MTVKPFSPFSLLVQIVYSVSKATKKMLLCIVVILNPPSAVLSNRAHLDCTMCAKHTIVIINVALLKRHFQFEVINQIQTTTYSIVVFLYNVYEFRRHGDGDVKKSAA